MHHWALPLLSLPMVGCLGFDESDGGPYTPPPRDCSQVTHVAHYVGGSVLGPTKERSSITFPPTSPGDLLVITIVNPTATSRPTFDAPAGTAVLQTLSQAEHCNRAVWVWSFGNLPVGTSSAAFTGAGDWYAAYALVFSGLPASAADVRGTRPENFNEGTNTPMAHSGRVEACPGDAVVSSLVSCSDVTEMAPTTPFTSVGMVDMSGVAYYVPDAPGEFGASWMYEGQSWAGHTLAYY